MISDFILKDEHGTYDSYLGQSSYGGGIYCLGASAAFVGFFVTGMMGRFGYDSSQRV